MLFHIDFPTVKLLLIKAYCSFLFDHMNPLLESESFFTWGETFRICLQFKLFIYMKKK